MTSAANKNTPQSSDIMVSVCMITYNHEAYIVQAIEGVLIQQTDFKVELVIGEDSSTDGTRKIVREYAEKHPQIIKARLNESNKGAMSNFISTLKECTGKYIALCEGDDYWTDPLKLQKQVNFLEDNEKYSACIHRTYLLNQNTGELKLHKQLMANPFCTLSDVIKGGFYATASLMFRKRVIQELPQWFGDCQVGDWPLLILCARLGDIGFIDEPMSVYRAHQGGLMSGVDVAKKHQMLIKTIDIVSANFDPKYKKLFQYNISNHYAIMASMSADCNDLPQAIYYLKKSIDERPLGTGWRGWIDRLVLMGKIYTPQLYRMAKLIQEKVT